MEQSPGARARWVQQWKRCSRLCNVVVSENSSELCGVVQTPERLIPTLSRKQLDRTFGSAGLRFKGCVVPLAFCS